MLLNGCEKSGHLLSKVTDKPVCCLLSSFPFLLFLVLRCIFPRARRGQGGRDRRGLTSNSIIDNVFLSGSTTSARRPPLTLRSNLGRRSFDTRLTARRRPVALATQSPAFLRYLAKRLREERAGTMREAMRQTFPGQVDPMRSRGLHPAGRYLVRVHKTHKAGDNGTSGPHRIPKFRVEVAEAKAYLLIYLEADPMSGGVRGGVT
mmetsp:Transcript_38851/g.116798  ORF Transcript_38851/g.116798 Transcript_38851/m.116798 type:complete len:205 (+) Transcript_38851:561-1175(+)